MTTVHWTYLPLMKPKNMTHGQIENIVARAANEWNKTMYDLVNFRCGTGDLQVRVFFGDSIDLIKYPNRIAECRDKKGNWEIEFDIRTKWNGGGWFKRLLGIHENLLAAAIHEFGHVMDLPHSLNYDHIMHANIADSNVITKSESAKYRQFFIEREKFSD